MSQHSTGLSRREHGAASGDNPDDFPLDHLHRWASWCQLVGVDPSTAWRWVQAGNGPIITKLGPKAKGVRHRHHIAWCAAREQQTEAL